MQENQSVCSFSEHSVISLMMMMMMMARYHHHHHHNHHHHPLYLIVSWITT